MLLAKYGLHPLIGLRLANDHGYTPWMSLDFAECDRARVARDPKYDGRFYTGVRTTGIYCRPVCPVRPARSVNVTFFPAPHPELLSSRARRGRRACLVGGEDHVPPRRQHRLCQAARGVA